MTLDVDVLLFAGLREAVGRPCVHLSIAGPARVADLLAALEERHPRLRPHRGSFAIAVNRAVVAPDVALAAGDEVALLPPVGGG